MAAARLNYPVHTLDDRLLLPAGTLLSAEVLDELVSSNRRNKYPSVPVLKYDSIRQDLLASLRQEPYRTIFGNRLVLAEVLGLLGEARLPLPVLETIRHFKITALYTYMHILRVFALSTRLTQVLAPGQDHSREVIAAGLVHDCGKICVPPEILKKKSPLTESERGLLEHHTLAGYVLLCFYMRERDNPLARMAREHHERSDGSGYPLGTRASNLKVEVISACDVYDALTSTRPYRRTPYDNRTALEEVTEMAIQGKIGWRVVKALIALNRKPSPHFERCIISEEKRGFPPPENLFGTILLEGV